ncbi:uncharacterized protein MELLADRAFT_108155 [Melampsora larici-populina 98AG31]|uniref:Secreted protein n=1 Tax=Melampsora larici-populina (strain 98AG31 / pathotype 3-4-7) TaxID=747676 RepID=F4RS52_MELLP|nr:uncharacterized protein MELLADRAFT_108155 [Melampsora larici-populina 98AG31]EGG04794.1 hypothetical protein MELLADRAFT_108155 [Melampsora larici-populina 98AG31]
MLIKTLLQFALLLKLEVSAHSFIFAIDGANGIRSPAFGSRFTLRGSLHQNTGIIKDEEISSRQVGPCGKIFGSEHMPPFNIDLDHELNLAEVSGIPSASDDGELVMSMYVHNRDGAGPFKCEYSPDASLKSFEPMNITQQVEGVRGINEAAKTYVYPLRAAFFSNSTCTGGKSGDVCVMRCRNEIGFGSCAAVKLSPSSHLVPAPLNFSSSTADPNNDTMSGLNATNANSTSELNTTTASDLNNITRSDLNDTLNSSSNMTQDGMNSSQTLETNSSDFNFLNESLPFGNLLVQNSTDQPIEPKKVELQNQDQLLTAMEAINQKLKDIEEGLNVSQIMKTTSTNSTLPNESLPETLTVNNQTETPTEPIEVQKVELQNPDQLLTAMEAINKKEQKPQEEKEIKRTFLRKRSLPRLLRQRKSGLDY